MMKKLAILVACSCSCIAFAQKTCSPADMKKAQQAADMVVTWQQMNKAWKDWRHCDTGEVADTFTDGLSRLLVEWKNVDALAENMKDPDFKSFVAAHLQSPAAKDDVASIRSRATQSCPRGQDAVCKEIAAATEAAKPLDLAPMATIPTISDPAKK